MPLEGKGIDALRNSAYDFPIGPKFGTFPRFPA